jgi:hypothetical protein
MTTDLAIFREQGAATQVAWASPGRVLENSPKLITRFASIFFSDFNATRDRGTDFPRLYRTGRLLTTAKLRQQFALAASEVIRQLGDQSGYPDHEQIVRAVLESATVNPDYTTKLVVRLVTQNGDVVITFPLERVP